MRSTVLLGFIALVISSATCRDLKDRVRLLRPVKDKRGTADHPPGYSQHPYNLNSFALPGLNGHNLGGYGAGYFLPPSPNSGLGHGFNLPPGLSQGSGYSASSLFAPSPTKTGPVTFTDQGPATNPNLYVTSMMQDLAKYFGPGNNKQLQFILGSQGSSQKAPSSSYQSSLSASSDSSNGVSGAYILASPGHDSAYIIPVTSSQSASSSPHNLPAYSQHSSSYGSSHVGLSSNSADSSSYSLPISSSHSALSGSKRYVPTSSAGSAYATANSNPHASTTSYASSGASYDKTNNPTYSANAIPHSSSTAYATISKGYDSLSSGYSLANYPSSSNYPSYATSYSGSGVAYAPQQATEPSHAIAPQTYSKSVSSYFASPSASQTDSSSGYGSQTVDYSNPHVTYSGAAESPSHSSSVGQYVNYPAEKSLDNSGSSSSNYDTISYSIAGGKYS